MDLKQWCYIGRESRLWYGIDNGATWAGRTRKFDFYPLIARFQ